MKCINCGTDNKLQYRRATKGRCIKCNHPFVFEPTSMGTAKITDSMFAKTLADISASYTLYFTPKHSKKDRKTKILLVEMPFF